MDMNTNGNSNSMDSFREKVSVLRKSNRFVFLINRLYTYYIEKTINYPLYRWLTLALVVLLFIRRIVRVHGFYLVAYTLGLYLLNLLLGFLSPLVCL